MAKTNKVTRSVNAGELSPLMNARSDQNKYNSGCKTMENFFPLIYGGAQRRPGLEYIATQKATDAKGRVIPFERSVTSVYMLSFENQNIRVFKSGDRVMNTSVDVDGVTLSGTNPVAVSTDGVHSLTTGDIVRFTDLGGTTELNYNGNHATEYTVTVVDTDDITLDGTDSSNFTAWTAGGSLASIYEIESPYLTADIPYLKIEHSADVMYITHGDYEPRKLSRTGDATWTLEVTGYQQGPFRDQNTTTATISASATTGSVTLTASTDTFYSGHLPDGSDATDKIQTGALFELIHAANDDSIDADLASVTTTSELFVPKGVTWDFTTNGTWTGTVKLQREYNNSGVWETVHTVTSANNKNTVTSDTEEFGDAQYRGSMTAFGSGTCDFQFSIRDTSRNGIVEITAVGSATSATATVHKTLGDTTATARWSEGSWSGLRGFPKTVSISPEDRLIYAGSTSEPLTTWGSESGDWTNYVVGTNDSDPIQFTLVGSGQQNEIQWSMSKDETVFGTVGGEHLLGASKDSEALTPTNVKARMQTTYGSEDIEGLLVNRAVLFVQRGGKKIREFLYSYEQDSHKADDLTVFANHITGDGIVDIAYQRTPDPRLWCVRSDGEMALMVYERDQNVFSWCRFVTDGKFESVAVVYGGENSEDEVWVTVKRNINGSDTRYIERFASQAFDTADEVVMLDAAKTSVTAYSSNNIVLASDTVWCNEGLCNSGLCGGITA